MCAKSCKLTLGGLSVTEALDNFCNLQRDLMANDSEQFVDGVSSLGWQRLGTVAVIFHVAYAQFIIHSLTLISISDK